MDILNISLVLLLAQTLRMATPIALAAIGGAISERSGVINLGLEGMMLMGAFFGVWGSFITGNPWIGIIWAVVAGALTALVLAYWSIRLHSDQIVVGVAVNLFALGITTSMMQILWGSKARSPSVNNLSIWEIPVLSDLPVIGPILGRQTPFVYIMLALLFITWLVLFRTPFGLRVRAAGEHPLSVTTAGVKVQRLRYICVIFSGAMAGLGGAYLSLGQLSVFGRGMSAGRGFIAIAAYVFGHWNPIGAFGASLVFGFFEAVQMLLQGKGIPNQFIQMIPYLATILALAGVGRARPPASVGVPYGEDEA
ncbi:MAG: ABC transporter permease [Anaerolineales bacterium]|nr:ABC transporter permease [Anaerolineales bacterium]